MTKIVVNESKIQIFKITTSKSRYKNGDIYFWYIQYIIVFKTVLER